MSGWRLAPTAVQARPTADGFTRREPRPPQCSEDSDRPANLLQRPAARTLNSWPGSGGFLCSALVPWKGLATSPPSARLRRGRASPVPSWLRPSSFATLLAVRNGHVQSNAGGPVLLPCFGPTQRWLCGSGEIQCRRGAIQTKSTSWLAAMERAELLACPLAL